MRDPLEQLLKQTDEAMGTPIEMDDLAQRVRRKFRNQRITRSIAITLAIVAFGLFTVFIPRNRPQPTAKTSPPPTQPPQFAETDARVVELVADLLIKHEHEAVHPDPSNADEYLWQLSQQRNRAALILVRNADRLYQQSHDRPAAEARYRLAIHLFPQSPAAAVAQERLRDLNEKGTES